MYFRIVLIGLIILMASCEPPIKEVQLEGLWLGKARGKYGKIDLEQVLYFNRDGTGFKLNSNNSDCSFPWDWINDVLKIDTTDYIINSFNGKELEIISDNNSNFYDKIEKTSNLNISLSTIDKTLHSTCWELVEEDCIQNQETAGFCTKKTVCFENMEIISIWDYYLNDLLLGTHAEKTCHQIENFFGEIFFAKSVFPEHCDSLHYDFERVKSLNDQSINTCTYKLGKLEPVVYNRISRKHLKQDSIISFCKNVYPIRFYASQLNYKGGKRGLEKHFKSAFKSLEFNEKKSGYITLKFTVSCDGEIGRFDLKQTDLNFDPSSFDENLVQKIFDLCAKLDQWIPGKDRDGNLVDSRKFLTFKIMDGKFTELLP